MTPSCRLFFFFIQGGGCIIYGARWCCYRCLVFQVSSYCRQEWRRITAIHTAATPPSLLLASKHAAPFQVCKVMLNLWWLSSASERDKAAKAKTARGETEYSSHKHAHAHKHTHAHTHAHTRTHARMRSLNCGCWQYGSLSLFCRGHCCITQ